MMSRTTAMRKLVNAIQHITLQKMTLGYSDEDCEAWSALHAAQKIMDQALFAFMKD